MDRPAVLRFSPRWVREKIYYKCFYSRHYQWGALFEEAELDFCSQARMYDLQLGDVISGNIAFTGFYELSLSKLLVEHASSGGLFVDVGANMGYFSILWACSGGDMALAYEASPRNISILQGNVNRNELQNKIEVIPKAAGYKCGELRFDVGPKDQTGWGGASVNPKDTDVAVQMVRLDKEIGDSVVEVLKVDVEGADTWVIYGCEEALRRGQIKNIYFEQNLGRMHQLGIKKGRAESFLRSFGYQVFPLNHDETEWVARI